MSRLSLVAPAVPAIASFYLTLTEITTLLPLFQPTIPSTTVSTYFNRWFRLTFGLVALPAIGTIWLGARAIKLGGIRGDTTLYKAGVAFTVAHYFFAYPVSRVDSISEYMLSAGLASD